jgi:hypothetical protein
MQKLSSASVSSVGTQGQGQLKLDKTDIQSQGQLKLGKLSTQSQSQLKLDQKKQGNLGIRFCFISNFSRSQLFLDIGSRTADYTAATQCKLPKKNKSYHNNFPLSKYQLTPARSAASLDLSKEDPLCLILLGAPLLATKKQPSNFIPVKSPDSATSPPHLQRLVTYSVPTSSRGRPSGRQHLPPSGRQRLGNAFDSL